MNRSPEGATYCHNCLCVFSFPLHIDSCLHWLCSIHCSTRGWCNLLSVASAFLLLPGCLTLIFFSFKDEWCRRRQIPCEVPELLLSGRSLFSASCSLRYTRPGWNSLNIILGAQENCAKQACQPGECWIFHQWASTRWVSGQRSHSWADVQRSYTLQLMWTYWPLCHWLQGRWQRPGIWELLPVKGAGLESVAPAFFSHFPAQELDPGQGKALTAHPSSARQWWNTCHCLLRE